MPNFADPNLDFALEEQLQKAKWLRAQEQQNQRTQPYLGTSRYVAPGKMGAFAGDVMTHIAGDRNANQAATQMRGLSAEQIARIEALNQQLNSPQNINWSDPQAIQAENSRRAQIIGQQQRLPMVAGSANKVQEQLQRFPETMMQQKQKADEIAARLADQQASYKTLQEARLQAQADRQAQADQTRMLIAAMNNQSREKTAGSTGRKKLSSAERKTMLETDKLLGSILNAQALLREKPEGVGIKTLMPDIALQRLDPEGIKLRGALSALSAEKIHELSGAAVSDAEFKRLKPFLPSMGDSPEKIRVDLENMYEALQRIKAERGTVSDGSIEEPAPIEDKEVLVNDADAWEALEPGTKWRTPDGKTGVR